MNKLLNNFAILAILLMSSFSIKAQEIPYTLAKNYFVKNSYPEKTLHLLKITEQNQFDEIFGAAPLMGKDGMPTPIDFSRNFVIAVIDDKSNTTSGITVSSLQTKNAELRLNYDLSVKEKRDSAYFRFFAILIVDKKYEAPVYANVPAMENFPVVGGDIDESGCKPSAGYSWSVLENNCIQPWTTKYVFEGELHNAPLIFSEDNGKAEIMLSEKLPKNFILIKKPKANSWVNGNLVLTQIKKDQFILKDNKKVIAKGKLRK